MSNFSNDLKEAKKFELLTVRELNRLGYEAQMNPVEWRGGTHPPDIIVNGVPCEVKSDIMSKATGNLCFEVKALSSVDAKWLFMYNHRQGSIEVFEINDLLDELVEMQTRGDARLIPNGGDARTYGWKEPNPLYLVHVSKLRTMKSRVPKAKGPTDVIWEQEFKKLL